jgi:CheY-like chemotaxis protein
VLHIALATCNALPLNCSPSVAPFLGNSAVDGVHCAERSQFGIAQIAIDQAGVPRYTQPACTPRGALSVNFMPGDASTPTATVLIVDDDPVMLRYIQTLLELDSYRVQTAAGGLEAVQLVAAGLVPDVVLLDVNMPGLDGLETLRQLLHIRPTLKVIMCSGAPDPRKALEAFVNGAQDFLTKPFRHLYLSATLERCLATRSSGRQAVPWHVVQEMWEMAN